MECQILFPGKNKKNIEIYHILKILPSMLSVKTCCGCSLELPCKGFSKRFGEIRMKIHSYR